MNGDLVIASSDNGNLCFIDLKREHNQMLCRMQTGKTDGGVTNRIRAITISPDEKNIALIKKNTISILPLSEVYRISDAITEAEKNSENEKLKELFATPYNSILTHSFENEQFDLIAAQYTFHNRILTFCRE